MPVTPKKPTIIMAQVEASGTPLAKIAFTAAPPI
jgi:hypothetical protein